VLGGSGVVGDDDLSRCLPSHTPAIPSGRTSRPSSTRHCATNRKPIRACFHHRGRFAVGRAVPEPSLDPNTTQDDVGPTKRPLWSPGLDGPDDRQFSFSPVRTSPPGISQPQPGRVGEFPGRHSRTTGTPSPAGPVCPCRSSTVVPRSPTSLCRRRSARPQLRRSACLAAASVHLAHRETANSTPPYIRPDPRQPRTRGPTLLQPCFQVLRRIVHPPRYRTRLPPPLRRLFCPPHGRLVVSAHTAFGTSTSQRYIRNVHTHNTACVAACGGPTTPRHRHAAPAREHKWG